MFQYDYQNEIFIPFRICLGPMADIWMYIIKHVKNESTVQMIKGNLRLNSKAQTDVCKLPEEF